MIAIDRIQAQLRESARSTYEALSVPPFTCFINDDDPSPWANYAIPDAPIGDDVTLALARLADTFNGRGRTSRFEFVNEFSPELGAILAAHGYVHEGKTVLMVCDRTTFALGPKLHDVSIVELTSHTPVERIQEFMTVQRRAFGNDDSPEVDATEAAQFQRRSSKARLFTAAFAGKTVSAGSLTPPYDGITEVAGIATLRDYRRRGIGTSLTHSIVRAAFVQGLDAVFLTAQDAAAGRIYARIGFQAIGTASAYYLPTAPIP